jgi:hypothetical protein
LPSIRLLKAHAAPNILYFTILYSHRAIFSKCGICRMARNSLSAQPFNKILYIPCTRTPTYCLNHAFLADFSMRTDRWQGVAKRGPSMTNVVESAALRGGVQKSMTTAMRFKSLKSNTSSHVGYPKHGHHRPIILPINVASPGQPKARQTHFYNLQYQWEQPLRPRPLLFYNISAEM